MLQLYFLLFIQLIYTLLTIINTIAILITTTFSVVGQQKNLLNLLQSLYLPSYQVILQLLLTSIASSRLTISLQLNIASTIYYMLYIYYSIQQLVGLLDIVDNRYLVPTILLYSLYYLKYIKQLPIISYSSLIVLNKGYSQQFYYFK